MTTSGAPTPLTLVGDSAAMECDGDTCVLGFSAPHHLSDGESSEQ